MQKYKDWELLAKPPEQSVASANPVKEESWLLLAFAVFVPLKKNIKHKHKVYMG